MLIYLVELGVEVKFLFDEPAFHGTSVAEGQLVGVEFWVVTLFEERGRGLEVVLKVGLRRLGVVVRRLGVVFDGRRSVLESGVDLQLDETSLDGVGWRWTDEFFEGLLEAGNEFFNRLLI